MVSGWMFVHQSSVRFSFPDDNLSKCFNGFSPNLVCALILWRSGLRPLMGKFHQFLTRVICPKHAHIFVSEQQLV